MRCISNVLLPSIDRGCAAASGSLGGIAGPLGFDPDLPQPLRGQPLISALMGTLQVSCLVSPMSESVGESRVNVARKIRMQQNLKQDRHVLECFTTHLLSSEGHELQHSKEQGS